MNPFLHGFVDELEKVGGTVDILKFLEQVTPVKTGIAGGITGGSVGGAIGGMGEEDHIVRDALIGAAGLGSAGALAGYLVQNRLRSILNPFRLIQSIGIV